MRPGLYLERATLDDVAALAALEAACFSHPWTEGQIADEIAAGPPGAVFVLRSLAAGGGPALTCAACAYRVVVDEMQVLDVAVATDRRRLGLARFLLRIAMRGALRSGARIAVLEVRAGNEQALALYEALGFVRQGIRREYYRQPVEDAVLLQRRLAPGDC